jgi:hypothetical protein
MRFPNQKILARHHKDKDVAAVYTVASSGVARKRTAHNTSNAKR